MQRSSFLDVKTAHLRINIFNERSQDTTLAGTWAESSENDRGNTKRISRRPSIQIFNKTNLVFGDKSPAQVGLLTQNHVDIPNLSPTLSPHTSGKFQTTPRPQLKTRHLFSQITNERKRINIIWVWLSLGLAGQPNVFRGRIYIYIYIYICIHICIYT